MSRRPGVVASEEAAPSRPPQPDANDGLNHTKLDPRDGERNASPRKPRRDRGKISPRTGLVSSAWRRGSVGHSGSLPEDRRERQKATPKLSVLAGKEALAPPEYGLSAAINTYALG